MILRMQTDPERRPKDLACITVEPALCREAGLTMAERRSFGRAQPAVRIQGIRGRSPWMTNARAGAGSASLSKNRMYPIVIRCSAAPPSE